MANQILARLGIVMGLDSSELEVGLDEMKGKFKGFTREVQRQSDQAAKDILALKYATETYGKTLTAVEKIELEMRIGKYAGNMLTDQRKKALLEEAAAYDRVVAAAAKANKERNMKPGGLTPQMSAALGYQTTDIITGLAGGQNPLMVLLQQGGQLRDQFGGFKPLFEGIASVITATRVAMVAFGGAIAGVGYALYKGYEEMKRFNAAIVLTNNYVGLTKGSFDDLAMSISAKYNASIGATKEVLMTIASSGQFTRQAMQPVAELITTFARVSGESASTVAEKLIPSLDGTAASAKRLNDQYHFLTFEQYKHIDSLEKQGKLQESIKYTADAFNDELVKQKESLGPLAAMWRDLTTDVSKYFDKVKSVISGSDAATQLDVAAKHIQAMKAAWGDKDDRTISAIKEYYDLLDKLTDKAADAEERAAAADAAQKKIDFHRKYAQTLIDMDAQTTDYRIKEQYTREMIGLDKISQLKKQKAMEDALAVNDLNKRIAKDPQISDQIRRNEMAKTALKKAELSKAESDTARDEMEQFRKKAVAENDALDRESEKLKFMKDHLLVSGADLDIALARLKTEQEIAEIEQNKKLEGDPVKKAAAIEDLRQIQKKREGLIEQQYDLKRLQDMNQSVFNNMGSAIDTFVRTGKFAFKDFARSVIQDLIAIAMKAQMMSMFKGFSFFTSGGTTGPFEADINTSGFGTLTASAVGGPLAANQPSIVGENGPELFVPQGAGTIVPNSGDLSGVMGGPQIVYNGPYINNMNAIDTQSASQFLAKNKAAVFAANQSASRSIPASR